MDHRDDDDLTFTVHLDEDDPGVQHYLAERHEHQHHQPPTSPQRGVLADPVLIVRESLAQGLPCPVCARTTPCRCMAPEGYSATHERAVLIVAALRHFGHLADEPEPPGFDPVEAARVIADRSGFMRYEGDGFVKIMQSDMDVDLATTYAMKRIDASEVDMIRAARAGLLDWRKSKSEAEIQQAITEALAEV